MAEENNILLPSPIIDAKEDDSIKKLCKRYWDRRRYYLWKWCYCI